MDWFTLGNKGNIICYIVWMVLTIVYRKVIFVPKESQTKIVKKIVKVVFMGAIVFPKFSGV